MKKIYFLALLLGFLSLNAVPGCKDDTIEPGIDIVVTQVIKGNPMKAGEVYPKVGETDPKKGAFSFDIQGTFKDKVKGVSLDDIKSIALTKSKVYIDAARCQSIKFSITSFKVPGALNAFNPASTVGCDATAVQNSLAAFSNTNFATELKKGGTISGSYKIEAMKDIPDTNLGASVELTFRVVTKTEKDK